MCGSPATADGRRFAPMNPLKPRLTVPRGVHLSENDARLLVSIQYDLSA
jgi:hypothetical protein